MVLTCSLSSLGGWDRRICLSPGVPEQPGHHSETPAPKQKQRMQWLNSVKCCKLNHSVFPSWLKIPYSGEYAQGNKSTEATLPNSGDGPVKDRDSLDEPGTCHERKHAYNTMSKSSVSMWKLRHEDRNYPNRTQLGVGIIVIECRASSSLSKCSTTWAKTTTLFALSYFLKEVL